MIRCVALRCCFFLVSLFGLAVADFHIHDGAFQPDYVLVASAKNITINCQSRYSVVVNDTSPGPPIYLEEGKTTWIRVWNRIPDLNFTMHWHGLTQRTAPFSDGTPLVSQWPIKPGEFFDYEIRPDLGDAGTYFYHSHVGFQQVTAHGALIVKDAGKVPYKYDDDMTFTFADYYPANDSTVEHGLLADPFKWSGEPQAIVAEGNSGNASFSNATDSSCAPHIIDVEPGKTYRLRVIGKTAISLVKWGIESHQNLQIIEADGQYTKPVTTDHIQVASGQRFSVLLKTKTQEQISKSNQTQYWIRYESRDRPTVVTGYALLRYNLSPKNNSTYEQSTESSREPLPSSLPIKSPITLPNTTYNWLEYKFQSLNLHNANQTRFPPLSEVTRTIYIQMNQKLLTGAYVNKTLNGTVAWVQNDLPWQESRQDDLPAAPYLITTYLSGTTPNYTAATTSTNGSNATGWDPATQAFPALVGETIDIVWLSNSGPTGGWDFHPMHAHGEHYWDLGSGNGTYDAVENEKHFLTSNYTSTSTNITKITPARRDTTLLYRYAVSGSANKTSGWRAWRIRVTEQNVGAWMMHCHVAQHSIMGMNTIWVFGSAQDILAKWPVAPYVNGYLNYGGSAYGNDSYDPLVNHYFDDKK